MTTKFKITTGGAYLPAVVFVIVLIWQGWRHDGGRDGWRDGPCWFALLGRSSAVTSRVVFVTLLLNLESAAYIYVYIYIYRYSIIHGNIFVHLHTYRRLLGMHIEHAPVSFGHGIYYSLLDSYSLVGPKAHKTAIATFSSLIPEPQIPSNQHLITKNSARKQ